MSEYMNYRESPAFRKAEQDRRERERSHLESLGYELVNVSSPFPWVNEVESLRDIRPEYEFREIKTGKRLMGMIDSSYFQAMNAALKFVENRHYVHGRGFCGIDHPDGDGTLFDPCQSCGKTTHIDGISRLCKSCDTKESR